LLGATVKKLKIGADAEIISALIDEMASAYDDPEQVRNHYYANEESLKQVEALAIEEQVATRLLESASASAIVMSYAEVMQKRQ
jgi:trigger factor